jgi:hypothetical protein
VNRPVSTCTGATGAHVAKDINPTGDDVRTLTSVKSTGTRLWKSMAEKYPTNYVLEPVKTRRGHIHVNVPLVMFWGLMKEIVKILMNAIQIPVKSQMMCVSIQEEVTNVMPFNVNLGTSETKPIELVAKKRCTPNATLARIVPNN